MVRCVMQSYRGDTSTKMKSTFKNVIIYSERRYGGQSLTLPMPPPL